MKPLLLGRPTVAMVPGPVEGLTPLSRNSLAVQCKKNARANGSLTRSITLETGHRGKKSFQATQPSDGEACKRTIHNPPISAKT